MPLAVVYTLGLIANHANGRASRLPVDWCGEGQRGHAGLLDSLETWDEKRKSEEKERAKLVLCYWFNYVIYEAGGAERAERSHVGDVMGQIKINMNISYWTCKNTKSTGVNQISHFRVKYTELPYLDSIPGLNRKAWPVYLGYCSSWWFCSK